MEHQINFWTQGLLGLDSYFFIGCNSPIKEPLQKIIEIFRGSGIFAIVVTENQHQAIIRCPNRTFLRALYSTIPILDAVGGTSISIFGMKYFDINPNVQNWILDRDNFVLIYYLNIVESMMIFRKN